ncbi:hypothetical protein FHW96_001122 [Novosphingobium sp. SG751A]|uniref:hypothetical protein n=1 Tax=Novosphingobium sp. SG751A TaxID=2587000 RepID=UPI001557094A|nr:hypothetical protein [Novosphingobium sp. SG751A]NOW44976.1 hypothetical protein [Novosphingobium sp. SG751A]
MNARDEMSRVIGEFAAELRRSVELPANNRKEMIQVRRVIARHISNIASIVPNVSEGAAGHPAIRSGFSKVRHATALHQASWLVVAIKPNDPGYLVSLREMREVNRSFIDFVKATLAE